MSHKSTSDNQVLKAPKFEVKHWVDANGDKTNAIELSDLKENSKFCIAFKAGVPVVIVVVYLLCKKWCKHSRKMKRLPF